MKSAHVEDPMLTTVTMSRELGCSSFTIRKYITVGIKKNGVVIKLQAERINGFHRVRRSEFDKFIKELYT